MLPTDSQQYATIAQKLEQLSRQVDVNTAPSKPVKANKAEPKTLAAKVAVLDTASLCLWKFKFVFIFLLSKGKMLLFGLTKANMLFTMLLSLGVYWTAWGWKFALGVTLSIYVHEIGHVTALKKFGVPAGAPAFIPGLGAFVRMKQIPISQLENARIGLAGPIWGFMAAMACYAAFQLTGWQSLAAIAKVGAWINLFNLLPIPPLDGGRGFNALGAKQKGLATLVIGLMAYLTGEGLLVLLLLGAMFQLFASLAVQSETEDCRALVEYSLLIILLTGMCQIAVQTP